MKFTRREKLVTVLEIDEAQRLVKQPNKRYITGIRNIAIMKTMLNMGLRVSEITKLKPGNINLTNQKMRIVCGKYKLDRDLIIPDGILDTLKEWKNRKPKNTEYFFTTIKGGKISEHYLCAMVKRYGKIAKIAKIDKVISPYTLRHTFATEFYR